MSSWGPLWEGHVKKKKVVYSRGPQGEDEKMLFMQAAYIFAEALSSPAALPSLPAAEPCSGQQDHAFGRSFLDGTSVLLEVMEVRVR